MHFACFSRKLLVPQKRPPAAIGAVLDPAAPIQALWNRLKSRFCPGRTAIAT
jgi:hypothetical protein